MSSQNFTYTFDGNEFVTPPFKVMQDYAGIPTNMVGKYFYELIGMSESQATVVKNDWQRWYLRNDRDRLLTNTDWTQNADVPESTRTKWQSYRQALRDVPQQADPFNVTWPTEPS
tara:strand:+ start:224 stop:568 length:345 start_codon:yes stop_codon:yes gene_type:complete